MSEKSSTFACFFAARVRGRPNEVEFEVELRGRKKDEKMEK